MWLAIGANALRAGALRLDVRPVADVQADVRCLPFRTGVFEGVECHHVIEHLERPDALPALREVRRVLMAGGVLEISAPDMLLCARSLLAGSLDVLDNIYSVHVDRAQHHRWGYTPASLVDLLGRAGFGRVETMAVTEAHEMRLRCARIV